jgi:uncharacterized membrane protein
VDSAERIYRGSVRTLSFVFVALGLAILVLTFAHGGGPLSMGVLLGAVFVAVGVARLWLSGSFRGWRGGRRAEDEQRLAHKPPSPRDRARGGNR